MTFTKDSYTKEELCKLLNGQDEGRSNIERPYGIPETSRLTANSPCKI